MATGRIEWRNGRPSYIVEYGYDGRGERQRKRYSPRRLGLPQPRNKGEARRQLRSILAEIDGGTFVEPTDMTLGEYLEYWLTSCAALRVRPHTLLHYRRALDLYVTRFLGDLRLRSLTPVHIQSHYRYLLEDGARSREGGLGATSVRMVHRILRSALAWAADTRLIAYNPAAKAELPTGDYEPAVILDQAGAGRLLAMLEGTRLGEVVRAALLTGCRRGEVLGWQWQDIDWEAGRIRVRRNLTVSPGGIVEAPTKTRAGKRWLRMGPSLEALLRSIRRRQAEEKLRLGPAYGDGRWVFAEPDGSRPSPNAVSERYRRFVAGAGLKGLRFHDLRHAVTSALQDAGEPRPEIARWMGWASEEMVPTYSHPLRDGRTAVEVLERAFGHQTGTKTAAKGSDRDA
ncbi:MAG: site-specific integrase [Bacillota bacterium]|nr:MAG: site-specific integrase [Bacillota bacterium]